MVGMLRSAKKLLSEATPPVASTSGKDVLMVTQNSLPTAVNLAGGTSPELDVSVHASDEN